MSDGISDMMREQEANCIVVNPKVKRKKKSENPVNKIYYVHLRCPSVSNSASVTAAIRMNKPAGYANVAFAFCNSKKQPMFSKRDGRSIAASRLGGKRSFLTSLNGGSEKVEISSKTIHFAFRVALQLAFEARELALSDYLQESITISEFQDESLIDYRAAHPFKHFVPSWFSREVKQDNNKSFALCMESFIARSKSDQQLHLAEMKEQSIRKKQESNK